MYNITQIFIYSQEFFIKSKIFNIQADIISTLELNFEFISSERKYVF